MKAQKPKEAAIAEGTPAKYFRVYRGIFEHRERIGAAIWTFLWLIDRTTGEVVAEDGCSADGVVFDGRGIAARDIARDLRMEVRSVYEHIETLVSEGYVRKIDHGPGRPNGFIVAKSKKWNVVRLNSTPEDLPQTTPALLPQTTPEVFRTDSEVKVHKPLNFSATHNRKVNIQNNTNKLGPEESIDDPSVAARLLSEECGKYSMPFQGERTEQIKAEAKKRGISCRAVAELMVAQWQYYKASRQQLSFSLPTAESFWTSGTWDEPKSWKWLPGYGPSLPGSLVNRNNSSIEERMARLGAPGGVSA